MLQEIRLDDGDLLTVPGVVPKLSRTPGAHQRNAPAIGQDTDDVMRELGLTEEQIAGLRSRGVIKAATT
jgi:formyl-CoA transferase